MSYTRTHADTIKREYARQKGPIRHDKIVTTKHYVEKVARDRAPQVHKGTSRVSSQPTTGQKLLEAPEPPSAVHSRSVSVASTASSNAHEGFHLPPISEASTVASSAHSTPTSRASSVARSTVSEKHSQLPDSRAPSIIHGSQTSRSRSVASSASARSTIPESRRLPPISVTKSQNIASGIIGSHDEPVVHSPTSYSFPLSRAPSERTASVASSIRSKRTASTVSAARSRVDDEYAASVVSNSPSIARSTSSSYRPSVAHLEEDDIISVSGRASSVTGSTQSSVRTYRSDRDCSTVSSARSRVDESNWKPTSTRASSKASSSKSSRKADRDQRGRSTTSYTRSTHDDYEPEPTSYSERSISIRSHASSERSSSIYTDCSDPASSTATVRPSDHNAITLYNENPPYTAAALGDGDRHPSSQRRGSFDMSVVSYEGSDVSNMIRPDASVIDVAELSSRQPYQDADHATYNNGYGDPRYDPTAWQNRTQREADAARCGTYANLAQQWEEKRSGGSLPQGWAYARERQPDPQSSSRKRDHVKTPRDRNYGAC
jgi:hypothetical protein